MNRKHLPRVTRVLRCWFGRARLRLVSGKNGPAWKRGPNEIWHSDE